MSTNQLPTGMSARRVPVTGSAYNGDGTIPDHRNHWQSPNYDARPSIIQSGHGTQQNPAFGSPENLLSGPGHLHAGHGNQDSHSHNTSTSGALSIGTQNIYYMGDRTGTFPGPKDVEELQQQQAQSIIRAMNAPNQQQRGGAPSVGQPLVVAPKLEPRPESHTETVIAHVVRMAWRSLSEEDTEKIMQDRGKAALHNLTEPEIKLIEQAIRIYITICIERGFTHDEITHAIQETATRWDTAWMNPNNDSHRNPVIVDILKWCKEGCIDLNEVRTLIANAPARYLPFQSKKGENSQDPSQKAHDQVSKSPLRANGTSKQVLRQELGHPAPGNPRVSAMNNKHMENDFRAAAKAEEDRRFVVRMVEAHIQKIIKEGASLETAVRRITFAAMWPTGRPIDGVAQNSDHSLITQLINWGAKNSFKEGEIRRMVWGAAKKVCP
ncbi:hypothetical protein BU16DRAFT_594310 [Lophium mytilinum]|uniref:Uncharacterized protein n=1 Tax=Lophium mytilinum TaxID=390894 RepID=A0A6A6QIX7_9PEZI|nr:hypothetical protein BU16DRAFT_594310 [Lophium mytilinum]